MFFETPSYRRNVQVKTLDQIVRERQLNGQQGDEGASGEEHSTYLYSVKHVCDS